MKVRDAMTRNVQTARPGDTVQQVARQMSELDTGFIPICEGERVVGLLTDRDIAIRAVAEGKGPQTPATEIMTSGAETAFEDDDLDEVTDKMAKLQIRRLVILDRNHKLCGVLSLGDVALEGKAKDAGHTLADISESGDAPAR